MSRDSLEFYVNKIGFTKGKAEAKGNICDGIDTPIDSNMSKVHQNPHLWHHGGIHHPLNIQK